MGDLVLGAHEQRAGAPQPPVLLPLAEWHAAALAQRRAHAAAVAAPATVAASAAVASPVTPAEPELGGPCFAPRGTPGVLGAGGPGRRRGACALRPAEHAVLPDRALCPQRLPVPVGPVQQLERVVEQAHAPAQPVVVVEEGSVLEFVPDAPAGGAGASSCTVPPK